MDYPDSNEIIKNQNKEKMLCLQYAARHYYNVAERINYALWACCFGSYIFSLFDGNMESIQRGTERMERMACSVIYGYFLCGRNAFKIVT